MSLSPTTAPNHHADHPGFAGPMGLLVGLIMLLTGRANARRAVRATSESDDDRVVDIDCGPGSAARAAARQGAQVTGIDPATLMLRLARFFTRKGGAINWVEGAAENLPQGESFAALCRTAGSDNVCIGKQRTGRRAVWTVSAIRP